MGYSPWGHKNLDMPSVRKPSLAIREGALGYRTPQPLPLPPSCQSGGAPALRPGAIALTRYDGELREPLVQRQRSQASMRVASQIASLLWSHGRD